MVGVVCCCVCVLFSYCWWVSISIVCFCVYFFFFKQKTAYEMRISDWSSDVCSSDLRVPPPRGRNFPAAQATPRPDRRRRGPHWCPGGQIGRASCRERVCQYV